MTVKVTFVKSLRLPLIFLLPPLLSLFLIWWYKYANDLLISEDLPIHSAARPVAEQPDAKKTWPLIDNTRPNWNFLFYSSEYRKKLTWIAITGDSITRNQFFYTIRSLFSQYERAELKKSEPPQTHNYQPFDSYIHSESILKYNPVIGSYETFIDPGFFVGMRRTRIVCCSAPVDHHGTCHYWSIDSHHLNKTQQPWSLTGELSNYARRYPHGACWSWDYRNFPDDDMRKSLTDYAIFLEDNRVELLYLMMNAGLHPLMHNWTQSEFRNELDQTFQVAQQHAHILGKILWHDITWVDLKELPPWKKHITNERVDALNDVLVEVIEPYLETIHLRSVSTVSRRAKNFVNEGDIATTGDGMHYNSAFNNEATKMDWSILDT